MRSKGRDRILIDPSYEPESRRRFTLAHELGHQLLGHASACDAHAIHGSPSDPHEQEANGFASGLLMPKRLFCKDIRRVHPRFDELSQLAEDYGVSLTAAALRYTHFTEDYCALVCFRPPERPWFSKSPRCRQWWLRLDPPDDSLVAACMHGDESPGRMACPARSWIENYSWEQEHEIQEDVLLVSEGVWLVMLDELPDPEDDPDLEEREAMEDLERRRMSFRRY